jgi:hypothetical protein
MKTKLRGMCKQDAALDSSKFCGVAAAVIGSAVVGAVASNSAAKKNASAVSSANQANIDANKLDPRVTGMLYGPDGTTGQGLIDRYQGLLDTPQNAGLDIYGHAGDNYVGKFGAYDMEQQRGAANTLMGGGGFAAPQVVAPSQNGIDLKPAYERFINGAPGDNPFLTKAIGSGIDMSKAAFTQQQDDSTKNLLENILPSIRSGAVMAGGYGGSRQGVAEGNALGQFAKEQERSLTNFGLGNTNAAVGAQSQAYDTDSNRALSATQGLGAQQYGVAQQDAQLKAQANALTSANMVAGIGANQGVLNGAYQVAGNQDQYGINRATGVNNLLQPYLSKNPIPTNVQPVYNNGGSAALGGAMAGLGMYNQFKGAFGSGSSAGAGAGAGTDYYAFTPGGY